MDKTTRDLAEVLWSRLRTDGYTYLRGQLHRPDGTRLVVRRELGPLVARVLIDLDGPEWSVAKVSLFGRRVYRFEWVLREVALS